jgi:hypothetical protein
LQHYHQQWCHGLLLCRFSTMGFFHPSWGTANRTQHVWHYEMSVRDSI